MLTRTNARRALRQTFLQTFGLAATIGFAIGAQAAEVKADVKKMWQDFHSNPRAFMQKAPPKRDSGAPLMKRATPTFPLADRKSNEFVKKKSVSRQGLCNEQGTCVRDVVAGRASAVNRIEEFIDTNELARNGKPLLTSVWDMHQMGMMSAQLAETPWSDTYWPLYAGVLGARYSDSSFMNIGQDWSAAYNHVARRPFNQVYASGNSAAIDELSPSEKYDLLIGEPSLNGGAGYLTPRMWEDGQYYLNATGSVEAWMGICHGWAPAAFMLPRPTRSLTVTAFDGRTPLKFYPSDMKGLGTLLWANTNPGTRFMGGRCGEKNPATDPATGRTLEEGCFDVNPGLWHQAVVNQIGQNKRSFVIDATYDYEVWNQPVFSYSYTYFDVTTGQQTNDFAKAVKSLEEFRPQDKFARFRNTRAPYVIGVVMEVSYVVETQASHAETDSSAQDALQTATYMYDLEIDASGNIFGGEWYSNKHPDYMWLPVQGARALTGGDSLLLRTNAGGWQPGQVLPAFWADIARKTALNDKTPVAAIVESLISNANGGSGSAIENGGGRRGRRGRR